MLGFRTRHAFRFRSFSFKNLEQCVLLVPRFHRNNFSTVTPIQKIEQQNNIVNYDEMKRSTTTGYFQSIRLKRKAKNG